MASRDSLTEGVLGAMDPLREYDGGCDKETWRRMGLARDENDSCDRDRGNMLAVPEDTGASKWSACKTQTTATQG